MRSNLDYEREQGYDRYEPDEPPPPPRLKLPVQRLKLPVMVLDGVEDE